MMIPLLIGACVVLALVAGGGTVAYRRAARRRLHSHGGLFDGLCRAHALNRRARTLLRQVARCSNLAQPARIFTEPKWLDSETVRRSISGCDDELVALREQLFGSNCDAAIPSGG